MGGYAFTRGNDVLTAQELEQFILELATARAGMDPPVSISQPEKIPVVRQASMNIDVAPDAITINLRSAGFGWLAYRINLAGAIGLRDALNAYFPLSVYPNQPST